MKISGLTVFHGTNSNWRRQRSIALIIECLHHDGVSSVGSQVFEFGAPDTIVCSGPHTRAGGTLSCDGREVVRDGVREAMEEIRGGWRVYYLNLN